jgi:energy-coupling factor transporter ATP-binding protein EcfA2
VVEALYETLAALHKAGMTMLLAEQSVELALEIAQHAYVLQTGRTVLDGPAANLAEDPEVQRIYLGLETKATKDFAFILTYRRASACIGGSIFLALLNFLFRRPM